MFSSGIKYLNSKLEEIEMESTNNNKLTDEQINHIAEEMDDSIKGTPLEDIANFPSNKGKEERNKDEISETGETRRMSVIIDPNTGENKIIGPANENIESMDDTCKRFEMGNIKIDKDQISESELKSAIKNSDITADYIISNDSIKELLYLVNKKKNNENFNVYKSFPEEVQQIIDKYLEKNGLTGNTMQAKYSRNVISESLLTEFIDNIELERIQSDFNKEMEDLFTKGSEELAESIVGYTAERNKVYREAAEKMEDNDKKNKLIAILDRIDEAYNLNELKEFAKNCKVKKFELEKPEKVYTSFLTKYENSSYNIYSLNLCRPIISRNLNIDIKFADLFLVLFCKFCKNMKPDITTDHAFMYYTVYNIVLIDMNRSENTKNVSMKFLENVKEVIENSKIRNNL